MATVRAAAGAVVAAVGAAGVAEAGPEPAALSYFEGAWQVDANMGGQTVPFTYRVTAIAPTWLVGTGHVPALNLDVRDIWLLTTDGIARIIVQSDGAWGLVRSRGWLGDTLVLEGRVMASGTSQPIRETITRTGPTSFDAVWEAKSGGTWTAYSTEKLRR